MELFITIASLIWFVLFTCIGNYQLYLSIKNGAIIKEIKTFPLILDILSTAWLFKMVVQWAL